MSGPTKKPRKKPDSSGTDGALNDGASDGCPDKNLSGEVFEPLLLNFARGGWNSVNPLKPKGLFALTGADSRLRGRREVGGLSFAFFVRADSVMTGGAEKIIRIGIIPTDPTFSS
jgi:hypothetical protein